MTANAQETTSVGDAAEDVAHPPVWFVLLAAACGVLLVGGATLAGVLTALGGGDSRDGTAIAATAQPSLADTSPPATTSLSGTTGLCGPCGSAGTVCVGTACRLAPGHAWSVRPLQLTSVSAPGRKLHVCVGPSGSGRWSCSAPATAHPVGSSYAVSYPSTSKPIHLTRSDLETTGIDIEVRSGRSVLARRRAAKHPIVIASPLLFRGGLKFKVGGGFWVVISLK